MHVCLSTCVCTRGGSESGGQERIRNSISSGGGGGGGGGGGDGRGRGHAR